MTDVQDITTTTTEEPAGFTSRRRFLFTSAAGIAALGAIAACGGDDEDSDDTTTTAAGGDDTTTTGGDTTTEPGGSADDLEVAGLAAALEALAVQTYGAALDAATAGDLGDVPPAVAEFVTTAQAHHQAALDAWNKVLTDAGEEARTEPLSGLEGEINDEFSKVTDVAGAAQLALRLESIAAATYLSAIPVLKDKAAIALAGSIQPIDMQHAAILRFALGMYPVPDVFASTEGAAAAS